MRNLFQKAQRGMEIYGDTAEQANDRIQSLLTMEDFDRILTLLTLLNHLANSTSYKLLASEGYSNSLKENETDRMNLVHAYVLKHFREKISLEDVASIANMSPSSFSRYFKIHANKTFSDFLTEINPEGGYGRPQFLCCDDCMRSGRWDHWIAEHFPNWPRSSDSIRAEGL